MILEKKLKDYKERIPNLFLITIYLNKTTNNWRDNTKINKNQLVKNCHEQKSGKMFTIILFIFWL